MNKIKDEFKIKIKFDYIITKRSIQNLTSWTDQKKFINQLKFFSGYSGWSAGQLDKEIEENSWIVINEYISNFIFDVISKEKKYISVLIDKCVIKISDKCKVLYQNI